MNEFMMTVGTTVAALFTIMIFSILFKDNIFYRFAESTAIGVAIGYGIPVTLNSLRTSAWMPITTGNYLVLIPLILGIMTYTQFSKKYSWISLWPMALLTGLGIALSTRGAIHAQFIEQIAATILPLTGEPIEVFNNLIIVISTATVLYYFLFTLTFKSPFLNKASNIIRKLARYLIMAGLGVGFAGTTLSWIVNVIVRIQFLLFEWLRLG